MADEIKAFIAENRGRLKVKKRASSFKRRNGPGTRDSTRHDAVRRFARFSRATLAKVDHAANDLPF
jgi:hypothetical protein